MATRTMLVLLGQMGGQEAKLLGQGHLLRPHRRWEPKWEGLGKWADHGHTQEWGKDHRMLNGGLKTLRLRPWPWQHPILTCHPQICGHREHLP